ncbi:hypothetical protein, partial [Coralloluteibacterium stylophorae]
MNQFAKLIVFTAIVMMATLAIGPVGAVALQEDPVNETPDTEDQLPGVDANESVEWIDNSTGLVDYQLDDGVAVVEVYSTRSQTVVFTDAMGAMEHGQIDRERRLVERNEVSTVRVPVTSYRGNAGITVDTGNVLMGIPLEKESSF